MQYLTHGRPENLDAASFLTATVVRGMCIEKRVFYRVVSGLHACINLHVAASYPSSPGGFPPRPTVWGPNATMFEMFFDPSRTYGEGGCDLSCALTDRPCATT